MSRNPRAEANAADMMDTLRSQLRGLAEVEKQRAELTAAAVDSDELVTVTVNADGQVVAVRFAGDAAAAGLDKLGAAVTEAARTAVEEVFRLGHELIAPLQHERARMPKISDLIAGMPDFLSEIPAPPVVSMDPPKVIDEDELEFTDVEDHEQAVRRPGADSEVSDRDW